jgi:adenylosuccinate lyase
MAAMIPARYDAPRAQEIFSDVQKYIYWKEITDAYATAYAEELMSQQSDVDQLKDILADTGQPSTTMVAEYEAEYGHDVVAFLRAYCTKLPDAVGYLIHDGLTSSDLVDYGLFQMTTDHAIFIERQMRPLCQYITPQGAQHIRPGRTHGQVADHTSWEHQLWVHHRVLGEICATIANLKDYGMVVKYPGPTGWPTADLNLFKRAGRVADQLSCELIPGTQIIHRDRLLEWAVAYLRLACALENLAQLVRAGARAEIAEVAEGATRVGSSSVPHKRNPIDCEKVCGMARVARGYVQVIAESVATWDDRDISNSSVERIAVPGLAAVVEHMLNTMIKVMGNIQLDPQVMEAHAASPYALTHIMQVVVQRQLKINPVEAGEFVRKAIEGQMPGFWQTAVAEAIPTKGGGKAFKDSVTEILDERFGGRA